MYIRQHWAKYLNKVFFKQAAASDLVLTFLLSFRLFSYRVKSHIQRISNAYIAYVWIRTNIVRGLSPVKGQTNISYPLRRYETNEEIMRKTDSLGYSAINNLFEWMCVSFYCCECVYIRDIAECGQNIRKVRNVWTNCYFSKL